MNITTLMKEYLVESTQDEIQKTLFGKINREFPVEVKSKPAWDTLENPERLKRKFKFKSSKKVAQFVLELLQYEKESNHNGSILIESDEVTIEIYTHDIDAVTELDIEYAKEVGKYSRMSKIMNSEKEFDRILSNPDNLIISDSLKGRIDFGWENSLSEVLVCFNTQDLVLQGKFQSYLVDQNEESKEEIRIELVCQREDLPSLLNIETGHKCQVSILENELNGTLIATRFGFHAGEIQVSISLIKHI